MRISSMTGAFLALALTAVSCSTETAHNMDPDWTGLRRAEPYTNYLVLGQYTERNMQISQESTFVDALVARAVAAQPANMAFPQLRPMANKAELRRQLEDRGFDAVITLTSPDPESASICVSVLDASSLTPVWTSTRRLEDPSTSSQPRAIADEILRKLAASGLLRTTGSR